MCEGGRGACWQRLVLVVWLQFGVALCRRAGTPLGASAGGLHCMETVARSMQVHRCRPFRGQLSYSAGLCSCAAYHNSPSWVVIKITSMDTGGVAVTDVCVLLCSAVPGCRSFTACA